MCIHYAPHKINANKIFLSMNIITETHLANMILLLGWEKKFSITGCVKESIKRAGKNVINVLVGSAHNIVETMFYKKNSNFFFFYKICKKVYGIYILIKYLWSLQGQT